VGYRVKKAWPTEKEKKTQEEDGHNIFRGVLIQAITGN